eukprot:7858-Heterococcus_DN1.PRE.2
MASADDVLEIGADGAYEVIKQPPEPPAAAAPVLKATEQQFNSNTIPREYRRPVIEPGLSNIELPLPHDLPHVPELEAEAFFSSASESEKSEQCASEQECETDVNPYADDDSEDAGFHDTLEDPRGMTKDAAKAKQMKEQGNAYYMSRHWHDAADCYSLALDWCPDDDSEKDTKAVYYCNRAACHLKLEEYDQTVEDCTLALEMK